MIDSGSGVNLIKQRFINQNAVLNNKKILTLQGISSESISTLGSITICLLGLPANFHVVSDTVSFPQDGILGNVFLKERSANIDYKNKLLHYDDSSIPFSETIYAHIKKRSVSPFCVNIANSEKQYGYIPRYTLTENVYFGEAIVSNVNGKAYLPILNITENDYNVEIPPIELQDFDFVDTLKGSTILGGVVEARGNETTDNPYVNECNETLTSRSCDEIYSNNITETLGHSMIYNNLLNSETETLGHSVNNSDHIAAARGTLAIYNNFNPSIDNLLYFERIQDNTTSVNFLDEEIPCPRTSAVMQLLRLEHLNSEELDNVKSLILNHSDRFHLPDDNLGSTNATQHSIPTTNEIPIHTKQYRYPPVHKDEIDKQVNELLSNDLIEYSTSPYNSPVWIVPKKPDSQGNKRWRMVIDYRSLNEKTIGDAYPLPNITDILDQLGSAKYFSVLDLASGFHQIPMAPKDAPKTAFSTPYGHYQFKRMPFGLKNAPATFQRLMDNVLSGLQGNELFVYMDDIVIYARSLKEHEVKFNKLMQRLRNANLKLQPDKCEFLHHEVAYLGHIIGADGVKPDPNKIKSIMEFPTPKNEKNIKQFLGLAGYYRRFIPQFSKIAKPLTDLLKKTNTFNWQLRQTEAFNVLKFSLCSGPILQYPDFTSVIFYLLGVTKQLGGFFFSLSFIFMSRKVDNVRLKYYLLLTAIGIMILYSSIQISTLHILPYPPFGIITLSLMPISSYLILSGLYYSARSISKDKKFLAELRKQINNESNSFLNSIGSAEWNRTLEITIRDVLKQVGNEGEIDVDFTLEDNDVRSYVFNVIKELKKEETSSS